MSDRAVDRVLALLDECRELHSVGENPSPDVIRRLFALHAEATGERAQELAILDEGRPRELTVELDGRVIGKAVITAGGADVTAPGGDDLDRIDAKLQAALVGQGPAYVHWHRASMRRPCYRAAVRLVGHHENVPIATLPSEVTCPTCLASLAADKRRRPARRAS